MERSDVYKLIDGERAYQNKMWGENHRNHSPAEWLTYIEDYVREAQHILSREPDAICNPKAMEIIRKISAMCVCAMEETETKSR